MRGRHARQTSVEIDLPAVWPNIIVRNVHKKQMLKVTKHQSILVKEVIEALKPVSGETYLDATFGGGGHTRAILEASAPDGKVVALDRDSSTEEFAAGLKEEFGERFDYRAISYIEMSKLGVKFDGIMFDLGLSADQLEASGRGFSFQKKDEPLDLRFDDSHGQTAAEFLRQSPLNELERVFRDYAEDRYWKALARKIMELRRITPVRTVRDFITQVGNENPKVLAPLFQGLRIEVNDELGGLKRGLAAASESLKPGGRLAVITFHSLEDRIVKEFMRNGEFELINKKPISPSEEEVRSNPRSRSAKLRAGRRI